MEKRGVVDGEITPPDGQEKTAQPTKCSGGCSKDRGCGSDILSQMAEKAQCAKSDKKDK